MWCDILIIDIATQFVFCIAVNSDINDNSTLFYIFCCNKFWLSDCDN